MAMPVDFNLHPYHTLKCVPGSPECVALQKEHDEYLDAFLGKDRPKPYIVGEV